MLFADYAMDIIYEIQNQIHSNSLANYENGIAGIGVGIDYLIQNNFLISGRVITLTKLLGLGLFFLLAIHFVVNAYNNKNQRQFIQYFSR